jgi:uncharacterized protein (TIGR02996 family)
MSDRAAFVAAIRAEPEEDTPRLAMADWLDEHDEPVRAEFIRVQCELARRWPNWDGIPADDSLARGGDYDALRRREQFLLVSNELEWLWAFAPIVGKLIAGRVVDGSEIDPPLFHRGFVELVVCDAEDWIACAANVLEVEPVHTLILQTWPTIRAVNEWEREKYGRSSAFGFHACAREMFVDRWPMVRAQFPEPFAARPLHLAIPIAHELLEDSVLGG